jgi:hypothetical protein
MRDVLDELIEAFNRLLPSIKREHGHRWVIFDGEHRIIAFNAFSDAARYAREHYGATPVLIRHTDERKIETAPFIRLASEG